MRIERIGHVGASGAVDGPGSPASGGGVSGVSGPGATTSAAAAAGKVGIGGAAGAGSEARHTDAVDKSALDQMVEGLNRALQVVDRRLQFLVHDTTGRILVKVINRETDEVIREIPPEKILDLVGHIHRFLGLLIDEKA